MKWFGIYSLVWHVLGGHWLCKMLGIINTCIHTIYAPTSSHRAVVRLFIWFLLDKWWEKHWYNNSLRDPIALCFHKYSKQVVYYHHVPLQREFLWYKCVWESGERQRGWCFITSLLFMVKEKIMWGEKKHTEQGDISAPVPHFRLAPFINAFPMSGDCLSLRLQIDDPVLRFIWHRTLRSSWVIHWGLGWHVIMENRSPEKALRLVSEELLNQAMAQYSQQFDWRSYSHPAAAETCWQTSTWDSLQSKTMSLDLHEKDRDLKLH